MQTPSLPPAEPSCRFLSSELFNAFPLPTTLIDADGVICDLNEAFLQHVRERGVKLKKSERLGHHIKDFVHRQDIKADFDLMLARVLGRGETVTMRWKDHLAARSGAFIQVKACPVRDAAGAIVGALVMREDVSEAVFGRRQRVLMAQLQALICNMRSSQDIHAVLEAVHKGLEGLDLPINSCGFNVVRDGDTDCPRLTVYCLNRAGRFLPETPTEEGARLIVEYWRGQKTVYRPDLRQDDPFGERQSLQGYFDEEVRSVLDVPFGSGTLAVNSLQPDAFSPRDIELLKELSLLVEAAFLRQGDLQRKEQGERLTGALEMAGAASHELSQPLQAISGALFELQIGLPEDHPLKDQVDLMTQQLERTQAIFCRLGRITRYRTRAYTPGRQIIDLQEAVVAAEEAEG